MNTLEFKMLLAERMDLSVDEVEKRMSDFIDVIKENLGNGDAPVASSGYLYVAEQQQEIRFDSEADKYMLIPPKFVVRFKASDWLNEKLKLK